MKNRTLISIQVPAPSVFRILRCLIILIECVRGGGHMAKMPFNNTYFLKLTKQ